jgi:apolipoprotein N-acyltransferase
MWIEVVVSHKLSSETDQPSELFILLCIELYFPFVAANAASGSKILAESSNQSTFLSKVKENFTSSVQISIALEGD